MSRHTVLRVLMAIPLHQVSAPRVLGIDDFALRRRQAYATIVINAETGERLDVLPGRTTDVVEALLRGHPGAEIVCRDGSGAYGEAVRRALPGAVQSSDRWHLWHGLAEAVLKEVAAHSACWASAGPPLKDGKHAQTTRERWRQDPRPARQGHRAAGVLPQAEPGPEHREAVCPRRRARADDPRPVVPADRRRPLPRSSAQAPAEDPAVPVTRLLAEIREQGYPGSANLLVRYITQGRAEADRPHLSPRRVTRLLLTRPASRSDSQQALLGKLTSACPEMTALADLIRAFAVLLAPDPENETALAIWIQAARASDLPSLHAFTRGLDLDHSAVVTALGPAVPQRQDGGASFLPDCGSL